MTAEDDSPPEAPAAPPAPPASPAVAAPWAAPSLTAGRRRAELAVLAVMVTQVAVVAVALLLVMALTGVDVTLARSEVTDVLGAVDLAVRLVAIAVGIGAILAVRRWARAVRATIIALPADADGERPWPGPLLGEGQILRAGGWQPERIAPARRSAAIAVGAAGTGAALQLAGGLLWIVAPSGQLARAGVVATVMGGVVLVLATVIETSVIRALERREVAALRTAGRLDWALPDEIGPVPRVLITVLAAAAAIVPVVLLRGDAPECIGALWRCGQLEMPASHATADPRQASHTVTWAVHPATSGAARGTFVVAVGGPGIAALPGAVRYLTLLDERIVRSFDVLFFDARGSGGSDARDCPRAFDAYVALASTPESSSIFASTCYLEAGVDSSQLGRYATAEVAGDLERIRAHLGIERLVVYGESYGTEVAQAYAAAYPDRTAALIIDGPVDRRLRPSEFWAAAALGFDGVLSRTVEACKEEAECRTALPDIEAALDRLLARVQQRPVELEVFDARGRRRTVLMTPELVESALWSSLYDTTGRMLFLRALAAEEAGDGFGIEHLVGLGAGPSTVADDWSAFAYYATFCADARTSPTAVDDDSAAYLAEGDRTRVLDRRTDDVYLTPLPCLYWPSQPDAWLPPADPGGIPTLVITATADPITRSVEARALVQRLPNARLIETIGGSHVSFGRGDPCVDDLVVGLAIDGDLPPNAVSCVGWVMDTFVSPTATRYDDFEDVLEMLVAFETELQNAPEYVYWDGSGQLAVDCRFGGRLVVSSSEVQDGVRADRCSWVEGIVFDGFGNVRLEDATTTLELRTDRGELAYRNSLVDGVSVEGTWDGRTVDLTDD